MSLASAFLQHASAEAQEQLAGRDDLEAILGDMVRRAHEAWPDLSVESQQFVGYAGQRYAPEQSLEQMNAEGLYLACACAAGNELAVAAFQDRYRPVMDGVYGRLGFQRIGEEITQRVMRSIFVNDGSGPALLNYTGRGSLGNWVRVLTVREAYRLTRKERKKQDREQGGADDRIMDGAISEDHNPELLHLKRDYRHKFKQSFQLAFDRLSHRERNILRYQFLDGLNLEQIGTVYDVSRATVARWRARARERLFAETRKIMRDEFKVPLEEFDGAMHLIESAMDVSLSRLLTNVAREDDDA